MVGNLVSSTIRDPTFAQACNVRPISPPDLLKLLSSFLPTNWFSNETLIANKEGLLTDEWLVGLWTYVLDGKVMTLFEDVMPMLPIVKTERMPPGQYLVKVSPQVPVLHMTYKDMPKEAASAFADLGLYIFDPSVLGGISYSQEVTKLVYTPSVKGVLEALCSISSKVHSESKHWDEKTRTVLREMVLDDLLSKTDSLSPSESAVLCSLPIWSRCGPVKASGPILIDGKYTYFFPLPRSLLKSPIPIHLSPIDFLNFSHNIFSFVYVVYLSHY